MCWNFPFSLIHFCYTGSDFHTSCCTVAYFDCVSVEYLKNICYLVKFISVAKTLNFFGTKQFYALYEHTINIYICIYIYIYIYICVSIYIYIYIYIFMERETEGFYDCI